MADGAQGRVHDVCIARQGIYDALGQVVGYELLFRPDATSTVSGVRPGVDDDSATATVIAATMGEFGVQDMAGDGRLFVNVPRSFVVGDLPVPLPPDGVVLEVLEQVCVDEDVVAGLLRLRDRGYGIALDDFAVEDLRGPLLGLADYVKVDLAGVGPQALVRLGARLRSEAPQAALVAERMETARDVELARDAGFQLFQGYHFHRPAVLVRPTLVHHAELAGRLLARLGDEQMTYRSLSRLTGADPAIALKVLRAVNSASGTALPVHNLLQALVLLGQDRLRAMLILEVMAAVGHHDDELALATLARTRAVEILHPAEPVDASTEELLRIIAGLLGTGVDQLSAQLHRPAPGRDAVLACDVLDEYVRAAAAGEQPQLGEPYTPLQVSLAYLTGVREARELLSSVLRADRSAGDAVSDEAG